MFGISLSKTCITFGRSTLGIHTVKLSLKHVMLAKDQLKDQHKLGAYQLQAT